MKALSASHYLIDASIDWGTIPSSSTYPFNLPIVKNFTSLEFHPKVTFVVGENGSGKSTLLEALAMGMGFNPEGGSRNFHFSTNDNHSELHNHLKLVKGIRRPRDGFFLRAESFYNVASEIENIDKGPGGPPVTPAYGGIPLHRQSHGEAFIALMEHRFRGQGLYILDEPEAALSPNRQLKLLALMHKLGGNTSQFIIATHSPILMGYPDAAIYVAQDGQLKLTAYEETDHYKTTKQFLESRQEITKHLFSSA